MEPLPDPVAEAGADTADAGGSPASPSGTPVAAPLYAVVARMVDSSLDVRDGRVSGTEAVMSVPLLWEHVFASPAPPLPRAVALNSGDPLPATTVAADAIAQWYAAGAGYWASAPATVDGVLGGFERLHPADVVDSAFVLSRLQTACGVGNRACLDVAAGVGRVTHSLLRRFFAEVDVMEPDARMLAIARDGTDVVVGVDALEEAVKRAAGPLAPAGGAGSGGGGAAAGAKTSSRKGDKGKGGGGGGGADTDATPSAVASSGSGKKAKERDREREREAAAAVPHAAAAAETGKASATAAPAAAGAPSTGKLPPSSPALSVSALAPGLVSLAAIPRRGRVRHALHGGFQTFAPPAGSRYDVIWCQWCVGCANDPDLISFLRRAARLLSPGGVVVVKDNLTRSSEAFYYDSSDHSITRSEDYLMCLVRLAGMEVVWNHAPMVWDSDSMLPIRTWVLRPRPAPVDLARDRLREAERLREEVLALYDAARETGRLKPKPTLTHETSSDLVPGTRRRTDIALAPLLVAASSLRSRGMGSGGGGSGPALSPASGSAPVAAGGECDGVTATAARA